MRRRSTEITLAMAKDRRRDAIRWWLASVACLALTLIAGGCGGPTIEQYVPQESAAKTAVETMLRSWQQGEPEDRARQVDGTLQLKCLDQDWRAGKRLTNFQVLDVVPPAAPTDPRQVRARLTYEGEAQPVETTYYVVGIDPLWVFRQEDYQRTSGG